MTPQEYELRLGEIGSHYCPNPCPCERCANTAWLLEQLRERDRELADAENALWDASREVAIATDIMWQNAPSLPEWSAAIQAWQARHPNPCAPDPDPSAATDGGVA